MATGTSDPRVLSTVSSMFCVVWSIARTAYSLFTCGVSALLLDNPFFITALFTCLSFPFNLLKQAMFWIVLTSKLPEAWRVGVSDPSLLPICSVLHSSLKWMGRGTGFPRWLLGGLSPIYWTAHSCPLTWEGIMFPDFVFCPTVCLHDNTTENRG